MAAISAISEFRSRLARIDFQLEDCVNIIRDYHMALVGEVNSEHQEVTPVPDPDPVPDPPLLFFTLSTIAVIANAATIPRDIQIIG